MVAQCFRVDLNKPLVFQVGHLGDAYDEEWVHQPIASKEGPRFFENGFLEFLTRTPWWAIPTIWLPVVWWLVSTSANMGLPTPQLAATVIVGIVAWTLLEYTLHRFVFHTKARGYWGITLHYLIHGCHHKHPMDAMRLVFPPAATAILLVPLWSLIKLLAPPIYAYAMLGGGLLGYLWSLIKLLAPLIYAYAMLGGMLLGYVMYDCTHYYLHHGKPLTGVSRFLKRYHMDHHFKIQDKGFGITSSFWDIVFGTLPPKPTKKSS